MNKLAKLAISAAIAGLSMAAQATLLVDDFSTPQGLLVDNTNNASGFSSTACGAGILGGCRDLFTTRTTGPAASTVGAEVASGELRFTEGADAGGKAIVRWDGTGPATGNDTAALIANILGGNGATYGNATTEGAFNSARGYALGGAPMTGINLLSFGNAFMLEVINADHGFLFTINLYTSATQYSSLTLVSGANGDDHTIPFVLFTNLVCPVTNPGLGACSLFGGGVDLMNVKAIEAILNDTVSGITTAAQPALNLQLRIDTVAVPMEVPEPGSLALVGVALLGLAAARRRKSA